MAKAWETAEGMGQNKLAEGYLAGLPRHAEANEYAEDSRPGCLF